MSYTKGPRISRERWDAAQAAWATGEYSTEWREWRHLAATKAGIVEAPLGTKWDNWGDDDPSERAILIRAIREDPSRLQAAILAPGVHSWAAVIAVMLRGRDERAEVIERDGRDEERRRANEPTPKQATYALREIMDIIGERA